MQLRFLTFNVFFEPVGREPRMRALGRMIERMRPAVVGFQEVTREALALLQAQSWAKYYDCSADTARPFSEAYFVVLFSALPVRGLETHPFANTGMGRELLVMKVEPAPGWSLFVGTAHLESLPQFAQTRVSQLKESLTTLRDRVNNSEERDGKCLGAVFMGDTNLMREDMGLLDDRLAAVGDMEVEPAKTGRSKCRECQQTIEQGAVRVGKMAKERLPNGKSRDIRHWFHEACFMTSASDIEKQFVRDRSPTERSGEDTGEGGSWSTRPSIDFATAGLPGGWTDLWLSVPGNTEDNGLTYDGKTNGLIKNRSFQSRLDRIYYYPGTTTLREKFSSSPSSILESIQIVGKTKISNGLWPSDHYGLLSVFNFADCDDKETPGSKRPAPSTSEDGGRRLGARNAPISIE